MTTPQKAFNATPAGQRAMASDADSRANAFILAKWLRNRNLPAYDDAFIATCNQTTLASIKDEMLADYNRELSQSA